MHQLEVREIEPWDDIEPHLNQGDFADFLALMYTKAVYRMDYVLASKYLAKLVETCGQRPC